MKMKLIDLLILVFAMSSCTHLKTNNNFLSKNKVAKDVPFKAREDDQLRQRVLILPWQAESESIPSEFIKQVELEFLRKIQESENYVLVNETDLGIDLNAFREKKKYSWNKLYPVLAQKGVSVVIQGNLEVLKEKESIEPVGIVRELQWQKELTIQVLVHDPKRKKEIWKQSTTVSQGDSEWRLMVRESERTKMAPQPEVMYQLSKQAVADIFPSLHGTLSQMKWTGRIALIKGDRVYLNVGRLSGLQLGDLLKVSEDGDEIFDPDSGDSLGKAPGQMKGTLEIISYFGQDGAVSVIHSGSGFQENDNIELY
jgi:hypothetical protein